jgi:dolichyl-phosphate-mannose--protein O-mannosyl transferase
MCVCCVFLKVTQWTQGLLAGARVPLLVVALALCAWSFLLFRGLSYGMTGPLADYSPLRWQSEWEFAPA